MGKPDTIPTAAHWVKVEAAERGTATGQTVDWVACSDYVLLETQTLLAVGAKRKDRTGCQHIRSIKWQEINHQEKEGTYASLQVPCGRG